MRKLSFIIVAFGMLVLSWLFIFDYAEVAGYSDLENLEINQKVFLSGKIVETRFITRGQILTLDSGVELICECFEDFSGREVQVEGIVSEFEGKRQVEVFEIAG